MELLVRIELTISSLPRMCFTTKPQQQVRCTKGLRVFGLTVFAKILTAFLVSGYRSGERVHPYQGCALPLSHSSIFNNFCNFKIILFLTPFVKK